MSGGDDPILVDNKIDRQEDPVIIATTDGGMIIAWVDFSQQPLFGDVFAQKLNASGELLWQEGGVPLCTAANVQISLNIVQDLNGGAYIIWVDSRNAGGSDIYGSHVNANGEDIWGTNGMALADEAGEQNSHTFWEDGQGGAILAYVSVTSTKNLRARRILSDGTSDWVIDLCDADMDQTGVKMCKSGDSTFGFAWRDQRNENDGDIYAQSVDIDGNFLWDNDAVVYQGFGIQENPRVTSAGDGNFFVTWEDKRAGTFYADIFAQKIDADGNLLWDSAGIQLSDSEYDELNPRLRADNSGGCYIVWDDGREGGHNFEDIYMQHLTSTGGISWEENGRVVCNAQLEQFSPLINSAGDNTFICWGDRRDGSIGMYYQVMDADGDFQLADNGVEFYWGMEGDAQFPQVFKQGENTVLVWNDTRYGHIGNRAFMQIIRPNGETVFPYNGLNMTEDLSSYSANQLNIDAYDYHAGGAVAAWEQEGEAYPRVYAQAVDDEGNRLWGPDGIAVSTASRSQDEPKISRVGSDYYVSWANLVWFGGFQYTFGVFIQKIVDGALQWGDEGIALISVNTMDFFVKDMVEDYILFQDISDVYVIRIDGEGNVAPNWPETGLVLCNAERVQKDPKGVMTDDGLLITWQDNRDSTAAVYGQLVDADGNIQWQENGVPIASYPNDQYQSEMTVFGDNYYFIWSDFRTGNDEDVCMQKLDPDGLYQWDDEGLWIVQQDSSQAKPAVLAGDGYVLAAWEDSNVLDSDVRIKRINDDGSQTAPWGQHQVVCSAIKAQEDPVMVPADHEYSTMVWTDLRSSGKDSVYGLYAQRIWDEWNVASDEESVPAVTATLEQNFPNPFNPETNIVFSIPSKGNVEINIYNIKGQKVKSLVNEQYAPGRHKVVWDGRDQNDDTVSSGIYFYRLDAAGKKLTRKMVLMK